MEGILSTRRPHRGGLKLGTFNIGTLNGREAALPELHMDIVCCQETCIAPHRQTSVARSLRSLGASVQWGKIRQEDLRLRGRTWGVRLGVGLAIIAFKPWCVKGCSHHFPDTAHDKAVEHRLLSAVVSDGFRSIFIHTAYADLSNRMDSPMLSMILFYIALSRSPIAFMWFVVTSRQMLDSLLLDLALNDRGWTAHSAFTPRSDSRPTDHIEERSGVLNELWFSPNLARFLSGADLEWPIGWSTHGLLSMECQFAQEEKRGMKCKRGLQGEELQRKLEVASEQPWPQLQQRDDEHSYSAWLRCLRTWLDVEMR